MDRFRSVVCRMFKVEVQSSGPRKWSGCMLAGSGAQADIISMCVDISIVIDFDQIQPPGVDDP